MATRKFDYLLLGTTILLVLFGIIVLAGASAPFSVRNFGSPTALLWHQILYGIIPGIALGFLAFRISLDATRKLLPILLLVNILLLIFVFIPGIGLSAGKGASRWVSFNFFSFQPSEFLKLTFLLYLAAWSESRLVGSHKQKFKSLAGNVWHGGLMPFLIMMALIGILLVLQPDVSTLGIIVLSGLAVYFTANTPFWHTLYFVVIGTITLAALVKLAPYRIERLLVFFNPDIDPTGISYQLKQAIITVGSGGLTGIGLEMGYQQLRVLPAAISDAIFTVLANETGFVGATAIVLLFLFFLWRSIVIAKNARDSFRKYIAVGIASWITLQAFVNMGAMLGLLPLTGIPLSFISYGGSHLVAELAGVGILLNISRNA